jgi:diguanylate cyclase
VTVSVGVSQYRAGEDLSAVVARADLALYEGKRLGRNRVEVGAVEPV